jgi:hypothetical protein
MQELLRQLDQDYYRSALLLVARAELEYLRQEHAAIVIESGRKDSVRRGTLGRWDGLTRG